MGIQEIAVGRAGNMFLVPLSKLRINASDFKRLVFSEIPELARSIAGRGQEMPMTVRVGKENDIEVCYITDGCRRFLAMQFANDKLDAKITQAVCKTEPKGTTEEGRVLLQMASNEGVRFSQLEMGIGFQRLQSAGWSLAKMAEQSHKSKTWVADCLALAADPEAIKDAVKAGKIKPATAKALRSADPQDKATALLQADMGQKVTGRDVKEAKEERKEAQEKPKEQPKVDAGIIADGLRARGFHNASDDPNKKGNITIRIDQREPPFTAVLVQ
jgi:hypothetical protein